MRCGDEAYSYDAFGNQTGETEDSNPFRYAGEYWDSESGLIYLRARYYDSGVGGFTSADTHWNVGNMIYGDNAENTVPDITAIMQSGNLYVYCMGNPVNFADPSGFKDVMLRYIVEKNNGSVVWNSNRGTVTVYMPGFKPLEVSGKNINGRTVVDSQFLMDNFALTEDQATHSVGESFNSADDAALAWGLMYNEQSISEQKEFSSAIYINSSGRYSFYYVKKGSYKSTALPDPPARHITVAYIHSHGCRDSRYMDEDFSSNDKNTAKKKNTPLYLVTPGGKLKVYDPSSGITREIGSGLPRDYN